MSRSALFDVMIVLQNNETHQAEGLHLGAIEVKEYSEVENQISRFDLVFNFVEVEEALQLNIGYNSDIYNRNTIDQLANHLEQLLEIIIAQPDVSINQLQYLSEQEKRQLLAEFNNTTAAYPKNKTIVELFEEQVTKTPNKIALVFEDKQLTYQQLNKKTNQLAHYLKANYDIQANDLIGIMLNRSEKLLIAILGILKSGAAYVSIDPEYPTTRKEFIIRDTAIKALITQTDYIFDLEYYTGNVFAIDVQLDTLNASAESSKTAIQPKDLAYVIYTSGSMGKPKGVMVEHVSVVRLVKSTNYVTLIGEEILLSTGAISFDATTFEYWSMLLNGGQLVLCSKETLLDTKKLSAEIVRREVNTIWFTSGWLNQLIDNDIELFKNLTTLIAGGDKLSPVHLRTLKLCYPNLNIINGYGPTENTTFSLTYQLEQESMNIPIGKPISNSTAYIIDKYQQLLPIGTVGEICVGGAGLARGYLNQPELTKEKFVPNPFKQGERIYKTGDLGRWLPDGNIEFIGRKDEQVKIRGYRIELTEIETALQKHPNIDTAVVTVKYNKGDEKELIAYIVSKREFSATDIRTYLSNHLPAYMVPNYFVQLDNLPLTPNGKIDKKALPDPEGLGLSSGLEYVAPRNEIEEKLVAIWQEILSKERISIKDNFFDLGGHSLRAARLASQIHKTFDVKITIADLFERPILEQQAEIIQQAQKTTFITIPIIKEQLNYPLSSSQRRLWVLSQFEEANIAYNMPWVYVFEGDLDKPSLEQAFTTLIERHEILRTIFKEDAQGQVRQWIQTVEDIGFKITYKDVRKEKKQAEKIREIVQAECIKPFNLATGPLLRASLYQVENDKWIFTCTMHHIISDGWSMNVLIKELLLFYNAQTKGESNALSPLRIQYKDYAAWQQEQLSGEQLQSHKTYWLEQFTGELPVLEMPTDKPRPAVKTYNGSIIHKTINAQLSKELKALSQEQGATLFMGLLATVNTLLYRYTNQEDIIIGSPIAGREHADLEDQIGFYINTLALRTQFKGEDSYKELLEKVKQLTLKAYEHQIYPFDELVDQLQLNRDMSRSALFDVMIVLQNNETHQAEGLHLGAIEVKEYSEVENQISKFDLVFNFVEVEEALQVSIEYNSDIYNKNSIEQLASHLEQLLTVIVEQPATSINQLDYLSDKEKYQLLVEFNGTAVDYPQDKTIIDLFEEQAKKTPNNIALVFEDKELTYKELNEKSNRLAHYLRINYNVKPDDLVGIKLERSEWMIIAILGILKSGGAYVPVDPEYPQERINYMIEDSKCKLVIDEKGIEKFKGEENKCAITNPKAINESNHLAYVIYTSGSTGKPKGVMIEHYNVVRLFKTEKPLFDFNATDVWTMFHSYCFDFSVWEMYGALLYGGKLIIIPSITAKDPQAYIDVLRKQKVTVLNQTPSSFYNIIKQELETTEANLCIRYVIFGGEALSPGRLKEWKEKYPATKLINMYGITETTVHVTYKEITAKEIETNISNIGKPIPTLGCYILDKHQNLLPAGVPGELYIGGAGIARGYLNREALTHECFIINPYKKEERLYRSGDKVKLLNNGELEFIGRKDDQVKIRGYRIELGEIEAGLQKYPDIISAVVIAKTNKEGEKELVAYIVSKEALNSTDVRTYLSSTLPAYMLPNYFVQLEELPLTPNGKIDKKALPDPEGLGLSSGVEYVAPRNEIEQKLVAIWQEILGKEKISIKDNFFELGGHSLKATRLSSQIHKQFEVKIELKDLFMAPTIENTAMQISTLLWLKNKNTMEQEKQNVETVYF